MPDQIQDFWPENIGQTNIVTPVSLLKQEASYLGPKTKQLVKAEVSTSNSGNNFVHSFNLVVPGLSNYKYQLFQVQHPITLYPATIIWYQGYSVPDQGAFIAKLQEILASADTKRIVEALLAQVTGPSTEAAPG